MIFRFSRLQFFHPILIAAATVAVIAGAASAWVVGDRFVEKQEALQTGMALERAEAAASVAEQLVLRNLDDMATLQLMAQQWALMDPVAEASLRAQLETTLRLLVRDRGERRTPFRSVVILAEDGRLRWSSIVGSASFDASDRDYFIALRDGFSGTFLSAPLAGRGAGGPIILAAQSLQNAAGDFGGVVLVGVRPEDMSQALAPLVTRAGGVVSVIRRQGELLARAQAGTPGPSVPGIGPIPEARFPWAAALEAQGRYTARGRSAFTGADQFRTARVVAGTNLAVFAAIDAQAELQGIPTLRNSIRLSVLGGLAAGLLAVAGGAAVSRASRLRVEAEALRHGRAQVERLHKGLPQVLSLRECPGEGRPSYLLYRGGDVERVTGWSDGRLNGLADWTPYVGSGTPWIEDCVATALQTGSAEYDWQLRQPDGSHRWMSTVLARVSARPGGGGEVVSHTRDVTVRYEAAQRAKAAREELEQTLSAAPVVVFRGHTRADGTLVKTFVSRAMEQLTGWPMASIVQSGGLRAIIDDPQRLSDDIATLVATEGVTGGVTSDYTMRCADGRLITVVMTMTKMHRRPGGGYELVGYIADVTAEREAKARAITSARLASLGEMSAGLAHELKQPLQAITLAATNTQAAVERGDAAAASQRLQRIITYAQRAGEVIEHLRRFARGPEVGGQPQHVAVAAAIDGAQSMAASSLRDAMVNLVITLDDPPPLVLGHLVALEQVLTNLIMNARDAVVQNGGAGPHRITVEAATDRAAGVVRITVSDTGGGLPASVLARLFQPFVSTKGADRGTGLGLSICHGLVTGMGGTITAGNEGLGAVFRITLPAAADEAQAAA